MDDLKRVSISKKYLSDVCDLINLAYLKETMNVLDADTPCFDLLTDLITKTTVAYKTSLIEIIFGETKGEE